MEIEDEMFYDDDGDMLNIIEYGFPRRVYQRTNYFDDMDELSFFRRFRLTKNTVLHLLPQIEEFLEFDNDLNNSISPINKLLATLKFYASSGHQVSIADFKGFHQSTASRVITQVSEAIAGLRPIYIKMPRDHEVIHTNQDFYRIARFPRVLGCIDGTHIKIQSPGGEDAEVYRNRKSVFSINTQVIGSSTLKVFDIVARWPGSTHDATIFNNSRIRARFEAGEFNNNVILGDSGYTLRPYCLTPLLNPISREESLYNEAHIRTQNTIERLFGVWKRRFPVLAYGLRCKVETTLTIITATAVLHNIALDMKEDVPPIPENINANELQNLIDLGEVPQLPQNVNHVGLYDYRRELIDNYFANL
ncbi:putative nuclease HARBI1 [Photinus pyralis]|uniref:putative nuclease HARBI1 n=1 Tax=Photinus pyralis TaxID=7054 RepID=UPI00126781F2|nr:putative nuclease HARBI1 [Photinus pyralis]